MELKEINNFVSNYINSISEILSLEYLEYRLTRAQVGSFDQAYRH